jgi:hypothetical protein
LVLTANNNTPVNASHDFRHAACYKYKYCDRYLDWLMSALKLRPAHLSARITNYCNRYHGRNAYKLEPFILCHVSLTYLQLLSFNLPRKRLSEIIFRGLKCTYVPPTMASGTIIYENPHDRLLAIV